MVPAARGDASRHSHTRGHRRSCADDRQQEHHRRRQRRITSYNVCYTKLLRTLGKLVFVLVSALSAMLAFFSSAVVVPVAVYAWGNATTLALLWGAWLLGGIGSYVVGRTLGRRVAAWAIS